MCAAIVPITSARSLLFFLWEEKWDSESGYVVYSILGGKRGCGKWGSQGPKPLGSLRAGKLTREGKTKKDKLLPVFCYNEFAIKHFTLQIGRKTTVDK